MTIDDPQVAAGKIVREQVRIPIGAASLAGELAYPECQRLRTGIVLVSPHPHMGGSMQNNVIASLAMRLAVSGAATLRFDYRGVGQSDGTQLDLTASLAEFWQRGSAPEDPLMIEDVGAAIDWIQSIVARIVIVGYSFGCYSTVQAMQASPAALILISPTIVQHDFARLNRFAPPTLVIYSENDFATPAARTQDWMAQLDFPVASKCYAAAEHFFRGLEDDIAADCIAFLTATLGAMEAA